MTNQEQTFFNYWIENESMLNKLDRRYLTEAYFYLYNTQFNGFLNNWGTIQLHKELSLKFDTLKSIYEKEVLNNDIDEMEKFINTPLDDLGEWLEKDIEEITITPVKKKPGRKPATKKPAVKKPTKRTNKK